MAFDGNANSKILLACKEKLEETRDALEKVRLQINEAALEQEVLGTLNTQRRAELIASGAVQNYDIAALSAKQDSLQIRRGALKAAIDYLEAQVPPAPQPS